MMAVLPRTPFFCKYFSETISHISLIHFIYRLVANNQNMRRTASCLGNVVAKGKAQDLTVAELKAAIERPEDSPEAKEVLDLLTYMSQTIKGSSQYFRTKRNSSQVS